MQATATIIREPNAKPAEGTRSSHAAPSTETAAAMESPTAATLAAKEKQMDTHMPETLTRRARGPTVQVKALARSAAAKRMTKQVVRRRAKCIY